MVTIHLKNKRLGFKINQIASIYGRNNKIGKYQVYSKIEQKKTREAPVEYIQYVRVVSSSISK